MFVACHHCADRRPLLRGVLLVLVFAASLSFAAEPIILTSRSKQFVLRGRMQTSMLAGKRGDTIYVDPALLTMICERVREAMQHTLGWSTGWRDGVFINIYQATGRGELPNIEAIPSGQKGWRYRIEMPDELTRRELLESLVEVLLLEYANHGAHNESVELPPWLIIGLTDEFMHGLLAGLTLQPNTVTPLQPNTFVQVQPHSYTVRQRYSDDVLPLLRTNVLLRGPLTVDQLNWPEYDNNGDMNNASAYRASAHLFVHELLKLRGGRDSICASLALLPEHLNWQTAFLRGFDAHFSRMLDVEKWWSLVVAQTRTHESTVQWSVAESQSRLEDILYTPMQVQLTKGELPHVTPVALQTLLSDWSFGEQEPILQNKLGQLTTYRVRCATEFAQLAEEYRLAIDAYLATRTSKKFAERDASSRAVRSLLTKITAALNTLDDRREQLTARLASAQGPVGRLP
jgi:hypothetical protein